MKAISFLGTANYSPTTYVYEGKASPTTKFFAATLPFFFPDIDNVLVYVTPQVERHSNLTDLKQELGDLLIAVPIPMGQSESDLWQIFNKLTDTIQEGEGVIFDITNSFRSLPFLVFLAVAFLRTARKVDVAGVYYGAFEARDTSNHSPVFDLSPFINLLDWLTATNRFVGTGDGSLLANLLEMGIPSGPQMGRDVTSRQIGKNLKLASQAIEGISRALRMTRPMEAMPSAAQLEQTISEALPDIINTAPPFALLAKQVTNEYAQFALPDPDNLENYRQSLLHQLAMIQWYLNQRKIIQAATLAREWVISLIAYTLALNMLDYGEVRMWIECALNGAVEQRKQDPKEWRKGPYDQQVRELSEINTLCAVWSKLSEIRNDIAHCGMRINALPAIKLERNVRESCLLLTDLAESMLIEKTP